jgi:hypothetical protein
MNRSASGRHRLTMKPRLILAAAALLPLVGACTSDDSSDARSTDPTTTEASPAPTDAPPGSTGGTAATPADEPDPDGLLASLTPDGQELASHTDWSTRPRYALHARLDPATGRVEASMRASLPVGADTTEAHLRWFPGVAAEGAELVEVTVDGVRVEPVVEESLVTVPLAAGHGEAVEVTAGFRYIAVSFDPPAATDLFGGGDALEPTEIGLLARSDDALTLGHWFPIWIPEGLSAEPELDGFGDIANFPAATFEAELEVPEDATVVTSGTRLQSAGTSSSSSSSRGLVDPGDGGTIVEGGIGLRDFGVVVLPSAAQTEQSVGDTRVVVTAPDATEDNDAVLANSVTSVDTLSAAFGPYP